MNSNDPHQAKDYEYIRRSKMPDDSPLTVKAQCDNHDGHCGETPDSRKDSRTRAGAAVLGSHFQGCAKRICGNRLCRMMLQVDNMR